jgi:5'-nucleotidase / UDP-sugar diphosphatase
LLAGTAALALMSGTASADFTLHVLHINDLHSRIEPINRFDSTCSAEDNAAGECFGGVARLYTKINELRDAIRAEGGNVIVLDAGDQFQGSLMYTTYKGTAEAEFMNMIGFDAWPWATTNSTTGRKSWPSSSISSSSRWSRATSTSASRTSSTARCENHIVLEVGGERIGIVSALATDTVETSSPGPNVIFQDEIDSLAADVETLRGRGRDQDHRADPCRSSQGHRHRRRRAGHRCGGGRAFAHLPVGLRSRPAWAPIRHGSARRTARSCPWCRPMPIPSTSATSNSPSTTRAS